MSRDVKRFAELGSSPLRHHHHQEGRKIATIPRGNPQPTAQQKIGLERSEGSDHTVITFAASWSTNRHFTPRAFQDALGVLPCQPVERSIQLTIPENRRRDRQTEWPMLSLVITPSTTSHDRRVLSVRVTYSLAEPLHAVACFKPNPVHCTGIDRRACGMLLSPTLHPTPSYPPCVTQDADRQPRGPLFAPLIQPCSHFHTPSHRTQRHHSTEEFRRGDDWPPQPDGTLLEHHNTTGRGGGEHYLG